MPNQAEDEVSKPFCSASPPPQTNVVDDLGTEKVTNQEIPKPTLPSGEHIFTLLPYKAGHDSPKIQKNNANKCEVKQTKKKTVSPKTYEELFRSPSWPRFFNVSLNNKDDFVLDELLLKNGHM